MNRRKQLDRPLVYSCSGCSSAAQMANAIALRLDHDGEAEMSCIAGVGGGVRKLVRTAASGRPILALDGCHLGCVAACLDQQGIEPDIHRVLTDLGVRKRYHEDYDSDTAERVYGEILPQVQALRPASDSR